jgi:hypothetical protein
MAADPFEAREGYVRDIRRQHQSCLAAIRDEEYPMMLTETTAWTAGGANRGRSGSMDAGAPQAHRQAHRLAGVHFSSSFDISVVPEDYEVPNVPLSVPHHRIGTSHRSASLKSHAPLDGKAKAKAFLKERSSSLPRILPPILDADDNADDEEVEAVEQHRPTLEAVREMQKFVCQQASDAGQFLPLPVATKLIRASRPPSGRRASVAHRMLSIAEALAKLHGITFAMRQVSPTLYAELVNKLSVGSLGKMAEAHVDRALISLKESRGDLDETHIRLRLTQLISPASDLPFSVLTHCNAYPSSLLSVAEGSCVLLLPPLDHAALGSPLVDLYHVVLGHFRQGGLAHREVFARFVTHYFERFRASCELLRVRPPNVTPAQFATHFKDAFEAGLLLADISVGDRQQSNCSAPTEACLSAMCAATIVCTAATDASAA